MQEIARRDGGGLDALINNAGIGVGGPLELLSDEEWRRQFDVNVFGQIAVTQALLPALRRARGRIVFISSIGGSVAMAFNGPYAASKHAIEAIGDALRVELHRSGVQVALIEPGSVATPIWDKAREQRGRECRSRRSCSRSTGTSLRRWTRCCRTPPSAACPPSRWLRRSSRR